MNTVNLKGRKVAILATDGFEQSELQEPKRLLERAGATTVVIAPGDKPTITGWDHTDWGDEVDVDLPLHGAHPGDYDALVLPGGVMNPDTLRLDEDAIDFVRAFAHSGRPLAAICHGPWTLIDAGAVAGKRMTSWPSLRTDLVNAGARWENSQVVEDHQLITSRKPDDIPAFVDALVGALARREATATT